MKGIETMPQILERTNQSSVFALKVKETPEDRVQRLIAEHKGKLATSFEELLGPETGQTQKEIQTEVDDFLEMREDWRKPPYERNFD